MIAILGQLACYTGKDVSWDEAMNSQFRFGPPEVHFSIEPPVKPDEKGIYPVAVPGVTSLA